MGIPYHDIYASDGTSNFKRFTYPNVGFISVAYTGGAATRTVAVTWQEPVLLTYGVFTSPAEACTARVTSKTALGFSLIVTSVPSGNLTTGAVKCIIVG